MAHGTHVACPVVGATQAPPAALGLDHGGYERAHHRPRVWAGRCRATRGSESSSAACKGLLPRQGRQGPFSDLGEKKLCHEPPREDDLRYTTDAGACTPTACCLSLPFFEHADGGSCDLQVHCIDPLDEPRDWRIHETKDLRAQGVDSPDEHPVRRKHESQDHPDHTISRAIIDLQSELHDRQVIGPHGCLYCAFGLSPPSPYSEQPNKTLGVPRALRNASPQVRGIGPLDEPRVWWTHETQDLRAHH